MRWLYDLVKRAVTEVLTEMFEPKVRAIVREEMERKWQEWEPRIRGIVREEMDVAFERKWQEWEPRIRGIVREEMDVAFERKWQEWEPRIRGIVREEFVNLEPRIRAIVREEIRLAMEEEWMPKLKLMWREEIQRLEERSQARFDALQVRLDTISETVLRFVDFRMQEWAELAKEVREIRSDLERVKIHTGLVKGE